MARAQREYTDDEISSALVALEANGGNVSKTAREIGIPRMTIIGWRDGTMRSTNPAVTGTRQEKRKELAERLHEVAWGLTELLPDAAKVAKEKGWVNQIAIAIGVALDKRELLIRGATAQPGATTNVFVNMAPDQWREQIFKMVGGQPRRVVAAQEVNGVHSTNGDNGHVDGNGAA